MADQPITKPGSPVGVTRESPGSSPVEGSHEPQRAAPESKRPRWSFSQRTLSYVLATVSLVPAIVIGVIGAATGNLALVVGGISCGLGGTFLLFAGGQAYGAWKRGGAAATWYESRIVATLLLSGGTSIWIAFGVFLIAPGAISTAILIEIILLVVTILILVMSTTYTARSFSEDARQFATEIRLNSEAVVTSTKDSTDRVTKSFSENTDKLSSKMEEHWKAQSALIVEVTTRLQKVVELQSELLKKTEEAQAHSKKMLEIQAQTVALAELQRKDLKEIERQRQETEAFREEQERRQTMPKLGIFLSVEGFLRHSLLLRIRNIGMTGYGLQARLVYPGQPLLQVTSGIGPEATVLLDFGDVTQFPNECAIRVDCVVADQRGRRYGFSHSFSYKRSTGWLGVTTWTMVRPNEWIWPQAVDERGVAH